jgi:hypothetical protein
MMSITDRRTFRPPQELLQSDTKTRLIPITQWNDNHPWPPAGGMRHLRFNCAKNGFASAFKKVGARVLVDEAEFFRCLERINRRET